jgi:oxygen-independent coproporphyrinogen-3 oxidase
VNEGRFPIFNGHVLSDEDLVLRQIILDLMCRGGFTFEQDLKDHPAVRSGLECCQTLMEDGLVEITPNHILVTALGKAFLRNICSCFDSYFRQKTDTNLRYSTTA